MSAITNWAEATTDPRFWACYYGIREKVCRDVLGLTVEEANTYYARLMGCADNPALLDRDDAYELVEGSMIRIPFPQDFAWAISMGPEGDLHLLEHLSAYPSGRLIAEVSGHERLPGLRWDEAKRIEYCLRHHWTADYPVDAVLPLLTPVIGLSEEDSWEEVRGALVSTWRSLNAIPSSRLDSWIEQEVERWELRKASRVSWVNLPDRGWACSNSTSLRYHSSADFEAFFAMLDRCS